MAGSGGLAYVPDYLAISREYDWLASQRSAAVTRPVGIDENGAKPWRSRYVPGGIPPLTHLEAGFPKL